METIQGEEGSDKAGLSADNQMALLYLPLLQSDGIDFIGFDCIWVGESGRDT